MLATHFGMKFVAGSFGCMGGSLAHCELSQRTRVQSSFSATVPLLLSACGAPLPVCGQAQQPGNTLISQSVSLAQDLFFVAPSLPAVVGVTDVVGVVGVAGVVGVTAVRPVTDGTAAEEGVVAGDVSPEGVHARSARETRAVDESVDRKRIRAGLAP